jgi:hypothetical protein
MYSLSEDVMFSSVKWLSAEAKRLRLILHPTREELCVQVAGP